MRAVWIEANSPILPSSEISIYCGGPITSCVPPSCFEVLGLIPFHATSISEIPFTSIAGRFSVHDFNARVIDANAAQWLLYGWLLSA